MASLFYAVWASANEVANGPVLNEGLIAVDATSAQSSTVVDTNGGNWGRRVRLFADVACFVTWGSDPTALDDGTDGRPLGAENAEYFDIPANEKIAVIQRS